MSAWLRHIVIGLMVLFAPSAARAQMGYTAPSLEWLIADSDVVVRGSISEVEREIVPNPDPATYRNPTVRKTVTLLVHETLKGAPAESLTFAEETRDSTRVYEGWRDAETELLWFFNRDDDGSLKPYGLGWSVIRIGVVVPEENGWSVGPPPIFNMHLDVLRERDEILTAARRAVDAIGDAEQVRLHQIDLPRAIMDRSGRSGDVNQLTVPVDERLEALAHRLLNETAAFLREGEDGLNVHLRLEGVRALRYFPSPENRRTLYSLPNALSTWPDRDRAIVGQITETAQDILQSWALEVQILPYADDQSLAHRNPVFIRFTNRDTQSIRILRPLDGSEWSWHMPYYRFTVRDAKGDSLDLVPRCGVSGLWANREWPDDYIILLGPGDSYEMQVGIHHHVPANGEFTVSFEYQYDPEIAGESDINYPEGLWEGIARSPETRLQLKGLE